MTQFKEKNKGKKFLQAVELLTKCNEEGLESGMIFKNFKELCKFLDEPIVYSKNSKIAQEIKFKMCFNYCRIKGTYKVIIKEIYSDPIRSVKD